MGLLKPAHGSISPLRNRRGWTNLERICNFELDSKGDIMVEKPKILSGRRGFMCALSGMASVVLFASPKRLLAHKAHLNNLIDTLEMEVLEESRPTKHPSITWDTSGNQTSLFKHNRGEAQPLCIINLAGKIIWEAINGRRTPQDISILIHQKYRVSPRQAYFDCLTFMAQLKRVGAIQV
jgi:hypothetical protein